MLIILIFLVLTIVVVLSIGSRLVAYVTLVNKSVSPYILLIYDVLKWPFVFIMVFISIKVIYTIAPNVNIPSKSVNKGALLTTIIWIVTTFVYSIYVTNFANYTKFYGNLSNLIILMIWIYWMSYIFVYGMTINNYKLNLEKTGEIKSL